MAQDGTFTWNGKQITKELEMAAARGLLLAAEYVLSEARAIVPIDEATLERSGVASVDREHLTAAVSFDTPYAVRQHEDMTYRHAPGRQAKYLEQPLVNNRKTIQAIIAKQIRKATK